jgi:hypothetical protein
LDAAQFSLAVVASNKQRQKAQEAQDKLYMTQVVEKNSKFERQELDRKASKRQQLKSEMDSQLRKQS